MTRTKQWKITLIALCAVLVLSLGAVGISALVHDGARAEEISITIYNKGNGDVYSAESSGRSESRYRSGNGSVTYNGETITADDAKNTPDKVITANITEEGLHVKAEAQEDSLFFCWATDAEAKNIVSMRSEDTFTYEEVQSFQSKGLYAFFVPILGEELRAAVQFKITYNDTLGDLYLFLGKENVENETLQKHGLPIPSGQLIDIPFYQCEVWSISSEPATLSNTSRGASNLTFGAIPKTEIDSTIDLSRKTSAVFKEWSATYGVYAMNGNQLLSQENRPLPEICDTANSSSSIDPDGSKQYFPDQHTPVDETWSCPSISFRSDRPPVDGISFNPESLYGNSTTNWLINPFNNKEEYNATITVLPQTISAEFQEVAIAPEIEVTPFVNDEMKDPITFDRESTEHITFYYGQKNSINAIFVNSDQLVKQPEYQVTQTLLDGTTGKYTSKTIPVSQVMGTVNGFNISEIDNSCTITIIPNYGEEYYIDTFTIAIDLVTEKGFEDIVSKESEAVTVVSGDDWYFNPQLTANGVYTFTSGISYQVDLSEKSDSQLHFQVKGSGVFTFEFYLDGAGMEPLMPPAYAVYGTGSQINKNGIKSGSFGDNTTALAKGNTVVGSLTDIHYYPCTILAADKVTRIDDVTDWCRASIAVTAGNDDAVTDIYVAHIAFPYNSEYGSIFGPHTAMSVRNVAYYQGHSNVSWDIYDNAKGDKSDWGIISAQSGGKEASQTDLTSGTLIDFSIKYEEVRYKFYGWSDGAELLSTEKEFSYIVKGKTDGSSETKIYAVLAPIDQPYAYRMGGEFYDENNLENALTIAAERSANVYVLRSVEIKTSVTIAPNVNLVIPFDETNRLHGSADEKDDVQEKISWLVAGDTFKYLTVTVAGNVTLTVQGGLYLGGVVNYPSQTYQGHTSGAYSEIVNDGKIIIDNGGIMDVYGHVTGNGSIEVNKNAKLYEPFLILDYAGGTNTLGIFSAGQTPFKRYAMINIECKMVINYGGILYGHATLYALSAFFSLDQPFVSYDMGSDMGGDGFGHDTIIMLTEGASVTISYNSEKVVNSDVATNCTDGIGQTKLVFEGGATFSYMLFSAMGLEIPTNSVYFSIPYNFEVELNDFESPQNDKHAQYETKTDFMIMPGATVKVGKGATLTLNANTWILDGMVQGALDGKSYPKAGELENAGYSKNGNLIVDGTLKIGKKTTVEGFDIGNLFGGSSSSFVPQEIPAIFVGVIQSNGSGRIEIPYSDTVLNSKIVDGIEGRNYFSYTSSARVFDAAHGKEGVIAELQAGHTYTATGSGEFKLESLKYTNTKDGEEKLTLDLNQQLHGSWKVDHSDAHVFDWTPVGTDAKPDDATKRQTLTRQCTELGCNATEQKDLLYKPESLGELTYNGKDVADADLQGLFEKLFGQGTATAQFSGYSAHNAQVEAYNVTVTLTNGYWLVGSEYQDSVQLSFKVNPKPITVKANDKNAVYGEAHALDSKGFTVLDDGLCANDVLSLKLQFQGAEPHDVGDYTIEITDYSGNTNYAITPQTGTYKVTQLAITVVLSAQERDYNGNAPLVSEIKSSLKQGTLPYEDQLKDIITISFTGAVSKDANSYPFTATLTETGKKNYTLTVEGGSYVINKKQVTVTATDLTSVYGEGLQELAYKVEGLVGQETIDEYINIFTDATETSPVGSSYTITVTWKDSNRPTNYEVEFHNGHYTITNAQFGNITFSETTVTFDGKTHKPKMDNAPEGATVEYTLNKEPFDGAKDAGTYELTATVKLANYEDSQPYSVTFTINKLEITVALTSVTRSYNGKVPTIEELKATVNDKTVLDTGDNLADIVTVAFTSKVSKDVGDYTAKVSLTQAGEKNYTLKSETESTYKITQEQIAIAITPYTREYDGKDAATDGTLGKLQWSKTSGNWAADEEQPTITFSLEVSSAVNVGDYSVKGECSDSKNYNVTFTGKTNAVKITPCTLTVTAADKNSTYGDQPVALTYDVTGLVQGDGASPAIKVTCEVTKASGVKVEGYVITVEVTNENELRNYTLKEVNGKYTVTPKAVTVNIADQNSVFGYNKAYTLDSTLWTVEGELANGEEKNVLQVTLSIPEITSAGTYAITGSYNNNNYTVTFEGSYEGTKGTFTVAKKTVEDNVDGTMFQALVNGEQWQADENYKLADGSLTFSCAVWIYEGEEGRQLNVKYTCGDQNKVSELSLTEEGVYEITVEIDDVNYQGSATYSLEIVGADGRTQHLKDVLDALKERAGELTPETLTTTNECFETLNFIKQQVDSLSEDEQAMAEEDLAPYLELVEAWNNAVDEDVIATAQAIAQAPINGLMVIASLNALVMAVYVIGKGGLLR